MTYSEDIKNRAFCEYCNTGSLTQAKNRLMVEGIKISEKTLSEWRERYNWDELKGEEQQKTSEKLTEKVSDFKADRIAKYTEFRSWLEEIVKSVPPSSLEGVSKVIMEIDKQILLLRGEATDKRTEEIEVKWSHGENNDPI
ncbi:MAG: hypothetical protein FD145_905 [Candidatus Saganbacteria bacterium]|uniref:Uncharacterized protein n=1 Tax=Candidatus Saganbacteria bacterium TaxID=2575572 RepID=A0A833NZV0_UNCSA|nr:MAG: hypothetical protein FD145_905 [Candidatus Saganbacteria bacterium]